MMSISRSFGSDASVISLFGARMLSGMTAAAVSLSARTSTLDVSFAVATAEVD